MVAVGAGGTHASIAPHQPRGKPPTLSSWWNWVDEPATGRWPDGENSNYGVITLADDVYSTLGDAFIAFSTGADALHAASGTRAADL